MSLFDNINNTVGKVTQGIGHGIGTAAKGVVNVAQEIGEKLSDANEQSEDGYKKCPHCGESIKSLNTKCPLCGYEFKTVNTSGAVTKLAQEINKVESKRNIKAEIAAERKTGRKVSQTDEKIASLVRNFVVPNNKEDIFDFMVMAFGSMDAFSGKKSTSGNPEVVYKAWTAKFEETYQKASLLFGQQDDFEKIQNLYDKWKAKVETSKPFSFFRR